MGAAPTLGRSGPATCPLSPCAPVQRGRAGAARPSGKPWALEPQIMRSDAKSQKIASSFPGITCFLSPTTPAMHQIARYSVSPMPHLEITQGKTPLPCQGPKKKMSETSTICFSRKGAHLLCSTYDFGREGRQGSKVCQCPYQFVCHSRRGKEGRSPWRPGISSRRPRTSDPPCSR